MAPPLESTTEVRVGPFDVDRRRRCGGRTRRYHLQGLVNRCYSGSFPLATFVVNISGCFVLGVLFTALTERYSVDADVRTALTVGLLGAYTTYSTFALETVRVGEGGALGVAVLNVVLSVAAGLVAVRLGITVGRTL